MAAAKLRGFLNELIALRIWLTASSSTFETSVEYFNFTLNIFIVLIMFSVSSIVTSIDALKFTVAVLSARLGRKYLGNFCLQLRV